MAESPKGDQRNRAAGAERRRGDALAATDDPTSVAPARVPDRTRDRPLAGRFPGVAGREHLPLVQGFLKYFAGLEFRELGRGDLNGLARTGVAPLRGIALPHAEGSKAR